MMKCKFVILPLLLLLLVFNGAALWAKDTITWMEVDFPPFLIQDGEFKGLGYGDVGSAILRENLSQYQHEIVIANLSRQYKEYKEGNHVCTVGLFKNAEREEFMYFSIPVFFSLPNHLIVLKEKQEELGGMSSVKLEDVLKNNLLVIGQSKNRSYSGEIDGVLSAYGNDKNTFKYESRGDFTSNFFRMLEKGRVDAIIAAPEEILYQAEKLGLRDKLASIAIEENSIQAWLSYVTCVKNDWGKQVIEDVNRVLLEKRPTERYRGAYERWLDDGRIEQYRELYKQEFLSVTE